MTGTYLNDHHFTRVFLSLLRSPELGAKFREVLADQATKIVELLQEPAAVHVSILHIYYYVLVN